MRKNKLTHLLEPSLRLYFVFLLLFAAVSALFSVAVAVIEAAVVAVLYLYFRRSNAQRQKEIIKYIESVTCNMDTATTGWTSPTSPRCGTSTIPPGRWWGFSPWTTMRS